MSDDSKTPPASPKALAIAGELRPQEHPIVASPAALAPAMDTAKPTSKARTVELWIGKTLAALLTGLYATGVIPTSGPWAQAAAIAATVLVFFGFVVYRTRQAAAVLFICLFALRSAACTTNARTATIEATVAAMNAASAGLAKYDEQHQTDLVNRAPDRPTLDREIQEWYSRRVALELTLDSCYRAAAVALLANDQITLQAMLDAENIVRQELAALGVKIP